MAQKTALEMYRSQVLSMALIGNFKNESDYFEQAKQIEKEQIVNAYGEGYENAQNYVEVGREQYYNEEYNK